MQSNWKGFGGPATLGLEIAFSIALGLLGGNWLDKKLHTAPWLSIAGFVFGLAAAARAIYRALRQANRELEEIERKEREQRKDFDERKH